MTVSSEVNVRSGANSSYDLLGTLSAGTTVKVIGETGGWYQIDYNGNLNAYVYSSYLTGDKPSFTTTQAYNYDYNNDYNNNYNDYNNYNNDYSYDNNNNENYNDYQSYDYQSYDNGNDY